MRSNRSSGNRTTELRLVHLMRAVRISGWRRGSLLPGRPDFIFCHARVAVFVDGCFWHGCACRRVPKTNRAYWVQKFLDNRARDRRSDAALKKQRWTVIRVREHSLRRHPELVLARISAVLSKAGAREAQTAGK